METINKVVSGASNMVFGENKTTETSQEPLSGETGQGTASEPFDKGNPDGGQAPQETTGPTQGSTDGPQNTGGGVPAVNTEGTPRPEHTTDKTGVTSANQPSTYGGDIKPSEANESQPNQNVGGFGTAEPSVGADPESAQNVKDEHQTSGDPTAEPKEHEAEAVKEQKDDAEEILKKRDPNDHSGEPMKMHDGSETKQDRSASVQQEGGGEHGKEKGTGEIWEKTSGLAADGGDFDATRPGAGREAGRLLEQKGIHREQGGDAPAPADSKGASQDTSGSGEKTKLTDKIKDKLHLGKSNSDS